MTRHDGAGGEKSPQPSLGSGDRAGEGLCREPVAVAWNQQCPPCPHPSSVPAVTCPHRGDAAPSGVVTARDRGHGERGQAAGTRGTTLDRSLCQGLAMAKGRRQGKGEQLSTLLFPLQVATRTFVKEEDLSKLEKDTTNIKKKAPAGEASTSSHPPALPSLPQHMEGTWDV